MTIVMTVGLLSFCWVWLANQSALHKLNIGSADRNLVAVAPKIIPRDSWQSHDPTRKPIIVPPNRRFGSVLHFFGPIQGIGISNGLAIARGAVNWHVNNNGWSDGAYSYIVDNEGNIYELRGLMWDQFANGSDDVAGDDGTDRQWYTIAWVGGDGGTLSNRNRDIPSDAAEASITWLVGYLRSKGAGDRVLPHSAFKRKSCPGRELTQLARALDETDIKPSSPTKKEGPTKLNSIEDFAEQIPEGGLKVGRPRARKAVVGMIQARLDALGYNIGEAGIDFVYGPDTAIAVKRFERRSGFKEERINGVMGKGGFRKLMRPDAAISKSATKESIPDDIVKLAANASIAMDVLSQRINQG